MAGTWSLLDLSNAFQGLLSGNELFTTKKQMTVTTTNANQSTYAPVTTNNKNLSLILGSPGSSMTSSATAQPTQTLTPQIIQIPSTSPSQGGTVYPTASGNSDNSLGTIIANNLTSIIVIGGLGFGAYLLLKKKK